MDNALASDFDDESVETGFDLDIFGNVHGVEWVNGGNPKSRSSGFPPVFTSPRRAVKSEVGHPGEVARLDAPILLRSAQLNAEICPGPVWGWRSDPGRGVLPLRAGKGWNPAQVRNAPKENARCVSQPQRAK